MIDCRAGLSAGGFALHLLVCVFFWGRTPAGGVRASTDPLMPSIHVVLMGRTQATDALVELIKEHGRWVEPSEAVEAPSKEKAVA